MNRHVSLPFSLLWAVVPLAVYAQSLSWPQPHLPEDAVLTSPGESMKINGVPTRILRFQTEASIEQVRQLFAASVRSLTAAPAAAVMRGRLTLGGRAGDFWETIQMSRVGSQTVGTWSVTPQFVPGAHQPVVRPPGFPESAQLLQSIDSYDAGKHSELMIGRDPAPIDGLAAQIDASLRSMGYAPTPLMKPHWNGSDQYVALYGKGREEMQVTLRAESGSTTVMVNRLTALETLQ